MHSYNESEEQARRIIERFPNAYFGISAMITFPNSNRLRSIVANVVPLNRILLETDAPYLAPNSKSGKPNYSIPAHVIDVAAEISQIVAIPLPLLLPIFRENTREFFGI